jgi:RNA polymerase sigma-70 factor (ECF subfamily)
VVTALPRSSAPSDTALVVAARAGEAWACEALFRRYVGVVHGLVCRLLGSDEETDDVVQETFIAAFSSVDHLDDPAAFRSWVCGIAVRRVGKLIRKRRLLRRLGLGRDSHSEIDGLLARTASPDVVLQLRALYVALERMPARLRVVLLLRRVEGATLEEIARWTGLSLATVKRRLSEADRRLGALLAGESP